MRFPTKQWFGRLLMASAWLVVALAGCAVQQPPLRAPYFSATSISLDSPTDGWAVGKWVIPHSTPAGISPDTSLSSPEWATITPAMAHLQHGQWRLAPASVTGSPRDAGYQVVRMLSPIDGWAASVTSIYHYDGVRWSKAANVTIWLTDLRLLSPTEGWAVGRYGILRFSHGVWQDVTATLPKPPADWRAGWDYPGLHSVAIVSSSDAWAAGDGGMIWQFDGAQWSIASSPYFPNRYYASLDVDGYAPAASVLAQDTLLAHPFGALFATQMLSATQGFSIGGANPAVSFQPIDWGPSVIEQYQSGVWQVTRIVPRDLNGTHRWPVFYCLAMASAQDGWIGGSWVLSMESSGEAGPSYGPPDYAPLILHDHAGHWTYAQAPAVGAIRGLAMVSADEGWAAADGGLLHYAGGQWRLAPVTT